MIDQPDSNGKSNNSGESEPSLSPLASASTRQVEAPAKPKQKADYRAKARKYGHYVLRFLVAIRRFLATIVGFLDKYDGAITALATVAIVVLTFNYVRYSKRQWEAMDGQLEVMRQQLPELQRASKAAEDAAKTGQDTVVEMRNGTDLQRNIARLIYGIPKVVLAFHSVSRDEQGRIWADVQFQNFGKQNADNLRAAIKVAFRRSPPPHPPKLSDFKDSEFKMLNGDVLRPGKKNAKNPDVQAASPAYARPIYPDEYASLRVPGVYVYIWGIVKYKDFTRTENEPYPFCRFAPAIDVLSKPPGAPYGQPWNDCP